MAGLVAALDSAGWALAVPCVGDDGVDVGCHQILRFVTNGRNSMAARSKSQPFWFEHRERPIRPLEPAPCIHDGFQVSGNWIWPRTYSAPSAATLTSILSPEATPR